MSEIYMDKVGRILRLRYFYENGWADFRDIVDGCCYRYRPDVLMSADIPPEIEPGVAYTLPPIIRPTYRLFNGPGSIRFVLVEMLRLALCAALVGLFTLLLIGFLP